MIAKSDGCDTEFYQEFFSDVALPADALIGELNDGWSVAQRLLFHERNFSGGVGYAVGLRSKTRESVSVDDLIAAVRTRGTPPTNMTKTSSRRRTSTPWCTISSVGGCRPVTRPARLNGPWGSLLKLSSGLKEHRRAEIAVELCGPAAITWR